MPTPADPTPGGVTFHPTDGDGSAHVEAAWSLLTNAEKERALRFHFERDRHRWIRGRAWVRQQLGAAVAQPAETLVISAEPAGRLYLPDHPTFDFNLSHTGGWIALGISQQCRIGQTAQPRQPGPIGPIGQTCPGGRIGIDLETIDRGFPALAIAAEFFLPEERDWIAAGPIDRFFQLWTAKEALMKATGRGMSLEPDKIRVDLLNDQPATITNLETGDTFPVTTWPGPGDTMAAVVLT